MKQQILDYLRDSFGLEGSDAEDLYQSYVETLDENISKFDSLLANDNFTDFTRAAHTIKGCALNSGHQEMHLAALELEKAAKANDKALCLQLMEPVKNIYMQLKGA